MFLFLFCFFYDVTKCFFLFFLAGVTVSAVGFGYSTVANTVLLETLISLHTLGVNPKEGFRSF